MGADLLGQVNQIEVFTALTLQGLQELLLLGIELGAGRGTVAGSQRLEFGPRRLSRGQFGVG